MLHASILMYYQNILHIWLTIDTFYSSTYDFVTVFFVRRFLIPQKAQNHETLHLKPVLNI